jgi:thiol-disulfide isomerase/thioredoxin
MRRLTRWSRRQALQVSAQALATMVAGARSLDVLAAADTPPVLGDVVAWPDLTLLDGQRLLAKSWQGQAVIVVFFATDCPYCKRHNARVEQLVQATKGQPLRVLGVAGDRDPDTVRRYLAERELSFAVTLQGEALHAVLSPRRIIPLTCVVDRSGHLREVIPGEMAQDDVLQLGQWATRA